MAERKLTHVDEDGHPRMVDVTAKDVTRRSAVATGWVRMSMETLDLVAGGRTPKGDPLRVAEIAGIMGGKRTPDLIPLCHALPATSVDVKLEIDRTVPGIVAHAEARVADRTGVEMEALTAVTVALLTVYDMVKAVDRGMVLGGIRLLRKEGGRSGVWSAEEGAESAGS